MSMSELSNIILPCLFSTMCFQLRCVVLIVFIHSNGVLLLLVLLPLMLILMPVQVEWFHYLYFY